MGFKKVIAFLLIFLLLVSNAGFAMTVHYCGGKMASVSSGYQESKNCCGKKMESNKKCCSNKTFHFKAKTGDVITKVFASEIAIPFLVPVFKRLIFTAVASPEIKKNPTYYCDAHAPPLFKLYHQYVFYA